MFSRIFIERPRLAVVCSIILVLTGIISIKKLPVAEYPEIAPPTLFVRATFTGASAQVISENVAIPIEDQINGVDDLLYYSSTSSNNSIYSCRVTFKSGTDTDMALVNLQNAVKRAEPKLPMEVKQLGVTVEKRGNDILAMFAFSSDGTVMDDMQLNTYIDANVKDAVARLDGVSSAEIMSMHEYSMRVWLNPLRMSGMGITAGDIMTAIETQNVNAAAGNIGSENSNRYISYKLNVQGRLRTAAEFGNIIVKTGEDGAVVRLRDVARVELGSNSYTGDSRYEGGPVVGMAVYRTPEANALATVNLVRKELDAWKARFPQGVSYSVAYDPTEFIEVTMKEIVETLVIALLLVVFITYLFLQDWRATLVPSVAIPVALLATFPLMYAINFSINVLTMFGLILVIGSLCDDAIVVVENCQAHLERDPNMTPKQAALKCMEEITGAILATTLVTIACYMPLAFFGGMVGAIYVQFAVTMCVSLCWSTFVAMTLSPAMCAIILRKPGKPHWVFKPFNLLMDTSRSIYLFVVKLLVHQAILTALLFGGVAFATWFLFNRVPASFLPEEDKGVIFANFELPPGSSQIRTNAALEQYREAVKDMPGIKTVFEVAGFSFMSGNNENAGMCIIQLEHWDKRKTKDLGIQAMKQKLQAIGNQMPSARVTVFTPPAIMGLGAVGGANFNLCAIGNVTADDLSVTAKKIAAELHARPETLFAASSYNADTPQLFLEIDREKAESLHVPVARIFTTLQTNLASYYINDYTMDSRNYKVQMQATPENRSKLSNISELLIQSSTGEMVPLSSLGNLRFMVGPSAITRFNKMLAAEINAVGAPGVSSNQLIQIIDSLELPPNYHIEWTGMALQEKMNQGQLIKLMGLALIFAYLFLVGQYESWTIPVPVMLSVLFSCLGALLGLYLMDMTLSIYAQLGMVMLIGLTAKNAILMVEFSKTERESGMNVYDAAMAGANLRYRAVLMTAWSFLFGVFPLVVARGAGAGSRVAIGVTTFSGLLLATIVGICFTPALYALFQRLREFGKRILGMQTPTVAASSGKQES
ncbi:MAG: efflux RND transporter permease subunit [Victivallales bacterium]|nr:efflux RND transporter permease subunit [Victivallales bacterium]